MEDYFFDGEYILELRLLGHRSRHFFDTLLHRSEDKKVRYKRCIQNSNNNNNKIRNNESRKGSRVRSYEREKEMSIKLDKIVFTETWSIPEPS